MSGGRLWCRVVRVYDEEMEEQPIAEFRFYGPTQELANHWMGVTARTDPGLARALQGGCYAGGHPSVVKQSWTTVPAHEVHSGVGTTED